MSAVPPVTGAAAVVCDLAELVPGEGRAFVVDGRQLAVFRMRDDTVRVLDAACPHRGGPLADGQADAGSVVCPLHLHVFSLADGSCATGADAVAVHPARVVDGQVVVTPGSPTGATG